MLLLGLVKGVGCCGQASAQVFPYYPGVYRLGRPFAMRPIGLGGKASNATANFT